MVLGHKLHLFPTAPAIGHPLPYPVMSGISPPPLVTEGMVGFKDFVVGIGRNVGDDLSMQMRIAQVESDLKFLVGRVEQLQVDVVVGKGRATAEGELPIDIGKDIEAVSPPLLYV